MKQLLDKLRQPQEGSSMVVSGTASVMHDEVGSSHRMDAVGGRKAETALVSGPESMHREKQVRKQVSISHNPG